MVETPNTVAETLESLEEVFGTESVNHRRTERGFSYFNVEETMIHGRQTVQLNDVFGNGWGISPDGEHVEVVIDN